MSEKESEVITEEDLVGDDVFHREDIAENEVEDCRHDEL